MKRFLLIIIFLSSISFYGQDEVVIDYRGVPSNIKLEYFWNNARNLEQIKSKSNILIDTINNGYYGDKEYLTFIDKKLSSIKYIKNGITNTVSTLVDGDGYLRTKNDTIYLKNGKLNGKSVFHSYYPTRYAKPNSPHVVFASEPERRVVDFKDNFVKSLLVYRKGILVWESYYKKYDYIKYGTDHTAKYQYTFCDSVENVFHDDGSLKSTLYYKNGHTVKPK